jgi:hypothetical protein
VEAFLLAYSMTPSSTLPQQHRAAELSSDVSPVDTSLSACPTNQPTGRELKKEHLTAVMSHVPLMVENPPFDTAHLRTGKKDQSPN